MKKIEKNNKKCQKRIKIKKKLWKEILKGIIAFVIGFVYLLYSIIKWINNLVVKMFLKLPRLLKVGIIYTMIALSIFGFAKPKEIIKEVVKEEELKIVFGPEKEHKTLETQQKEIVENLSVVNTCNLSQIECKIYNKAIEEGLTEDQAFILLSISKHETGRWTSKAFIEKHNLGGIMCNTGLRSYSSLDEGISAFVNLLKNRYFSQGLDTIEKIQPVYCPIGADNDPKNLNQYWLPMVTRYFEEYTK